MQMKSRLLNGTITIWTLVGVVTLTAHPCLADNPIVQTSFTADPAPMVYEDRLYLYTSHDEDVTKDNFYTMNDWHLYSTVDMVNWTDHGTPASLKTFSWSTDNAWAPQAVPRNGKIYLYVPINNNTGAKIGVAVADNPIGPFKDPVGKEIAQSGSMAIDPTVFIDDDGQAYLFWGNGNLRMVRLNSDMISTTGSVTSNIAMSGFTEGPWFYKRESIYYLVYAGSSEKISYATSSAPTGPWTFKGDIMGNPTIGTNHPGVVDYKGHSYLFYHNGALSGNDSFKRSVCVEEFTYGSDGSIPKVTGTTAGPKGIATLNPFAQVEAETIANSSGLKTESCTDTGGGVDVTSISNGDYIKVKDVDFLDGVTSFDARVSSSGSNAKIELHLDSQTGTSLGTCDVSGASSWTTKTCAVSGGSGKHDLFLKFTGGSGDLFKFNWWKFTGPSTPSGGSGGAGGVGAGGAVANGGGGVTTVNAGAGPVLGGRAGTNSSVSGGKSPTGGANAGGVGGRLSGNGGSSTGSGGKVAGGGTSVTAGGQVASGGDSAKATNGGSTGSVVGSAIGGQSTSSSLPGSGGASQSTAVTGSGGRAATTQGSGASTSTDSATATSSGSPDSDSCSCRLPASRGQSGAAAALWLVAAALLRRRRRAGP